MQGKMCRDGRTNSFICAPPQEAVSQSQRQRRQRQGEGEGERVHSSGWMLLTVADTKRPETGAFSSGAAAAEHVNTHPLLLQIFVVFYFLKVEFE